MSKQTFQVVNSRGKIVGQRDNWQAIFRLWQYEALADATVRIVEVKDCHCTPNPAYQGMVCESCRTEIKAKLGDTIPF